MSHYLPGEQDNNLHTLKFPHNHIHNRKSLTNKVNLKYKFSRYPPPIPGIRANIIE